MMLEVVGTTFPRPISCEGTGPNMTTSGVYIQVDYNYIYYDLTPVWSEFWKITYTQKGYEQVGSIPAGVNLF